MIILVPKKNIWTPQPKWGMKRFQRGILHPVGFWGGGGGGSSGTVTLSGESVFVAYVDSNSYAGIYVRSDGTIDKRETSTYTQIDSGTDWVIPNGDASSLHEIKCTITSDFGGTSGFSINSGTGTWLSLGSNRQWAVVADGPYGADSRGITFTLEIRYDGGSVLDSASYTVESNGA